MPEPAAIEAAPPASDQAAADSGAQAVAADVAVADSPAPAASEGSLVNQAPDSAVSGIQAAPTEGDNVHGGPPGSRFLVMRNMQVASWLRDPSHRGFNLSKPQAWKDVKVVTASNPHRQHGQTHMCVHKV